jgi:hypothetical protein
MYEHLVTNSPNMGNTKFRVNKVAWYINEPSSTLRRPLSPHRTYMDWRVLRSYMAIETERGIDVRKLQRAKAALQTSLSVQARLGLTIGWCSCIGPGICSVRTSVALLDTLTKFLRGFPQSFQHDAMTTTFPLV